MDEQLEKKIVHLIEQYEDGWRVDMGLSQGALVKSLLALLALLATEYDRGKVEGAVEELVAIRDTYDRMEDKGFKLEGDSWRNWKGVRNVISDRLEELTGSRTPELKGENRESGE